VDALQPGDTLTIGRGEYAETVARKGLGDAENQTMTRAEIPGTVLLCGDVDPPVFTSLPATRQPFVADFKGDVQGILDALVRRILENKGATRRVQDRVKCSEERSLDSCRKRCESEKSSLEPRNST
jgi:hypothetical protein